MIQTSCSARSFDLHKQSRFGESAMRKVSASLHLEEQSTDRHARRLAGFVPLPLFLVGLAAFTTAPPNSVRLASPDGQVSIIVRTAAHVTELEISYRGAPVIERSNLAFTLDGVDITQGAKIQ